MLQYYRLSKTQTASIYICIDQEREGRREAGREGGRERKTNYAENGRNAKKLLLFSTGQQKNTKVSQNQKEDEHRNILNILVSFV